MKREKLFFDTDVDPLEDYKIQYVMDEIRRNYESTDSWLYLGADAGNVGFAKIGITMGDLTSRSYSSGNPNYYIFCAFKCKYNISKAQLESIERDILEKFDKYYTNSDGSSKRLPHIESKRLSECFYDIDFLDFFKNLHAELFNFHSNMFLICGLEDEFGNIIGDFLDCEFNPIIPMEQRKKYRDMIIQ